MHREESGYILLVFGAALVVGGVLREEVASVLEKAITICLQCIGIG